ncbi:MAG: hypothetical protein COV72_03510 [Candidatus Omnitrophica bacterium CG11_big_fil_rev_8_21_14_0_20_42_13]|uniref:Peptidase M48 domain-containing protein n=1 Tax=Candidatus Ghiorseimicrobium undicola TaxID=1974746 RepID=A0A2H0LY78_9BACT|nr:MAG: hypothetical protein COV72_03510 [Candidatus Omnitrophica bacterium CG11_big_fil_rev_8_21_14_0_20_42_13]
MKCPNCRDNDLISAMTKQGVEVDFCAKCEGIWLDKNEIYHFTRVPSYLKTRIEESMASQKESARISPRSGNAMAEIAVAGGAIVIDYCRQSGGIWLDKDEINKLPAVKSRIEIDRMVYAKKYAAPTPDNLLPLPNLALRSGSVLLGMYALLILFLIILVELFGLPAHFALLSGIALVFIQFLLGPFFMDFSLRFLYRLRWVKPDGLPEHLGNFIAKICEEKNMRFPQMGIISDGAPNAFTYGHNPDSARIVITQGLMDLLSEEELEAVVAHEIGHALHWDMLVMTLAQLVPLVLYYIYRTLMRMRSRGNDKSAPYRFAIALCAYILYIITEFAVLWFSRIREFFADRFSGEVTAKPNNLASALVKIGYGLAGDDRGKKNVKEEKRAGALNAVGPMGIFDSKSANILAITGHSPSRRMGGEIDKEKLKDAAKWDLWNPWAAYYELQSTHPLIAKRIKFLSNQSRVLGKEPYIQFDENRPESYWDEFFTDLAVNFLPAAGFLAAAAFFLANQKALFAGIGLFVFGICSLIKVLFSYPSKDFAEMTVSGLLKKVKVSSVRPVPCVVKGKIIGRGIPGLIYSEDFILQDESGIIFLDYQQPLGIFNFFFGLLRSARYIGQDVQITGWYRRAPIPYIEIRNLKAGRQESTCYVYHSQLFFSAAIIVISFFMVLSSL